MSDLKLENGDLVIDGTKNDLAVYNLVEDAVFENIKRRIRTAKLQYTAYYHHLAKGRSQIIDYDYGTDLIKLPGLPYALVKQKLIDNVIGALQNETRIIVNAVDIRDVNSYSISVSLDYSYHGTRYVIEA